MRVTAAFSRLLDLSGVWVKKVRFEPDRVVVWVALRRRRLVCPKCEFSTRNRESKQQHDSVWRHLDLGVWRLEIRARLRRLRCPEHGVHVEGVPFETARGSRATSKTSSAGSRTLRLASRKPAMWSSARRLPLSVMCDLAAMYCRSAESRGSTVSPSSQNSNKRRGAPRNHKKRLSWHDRR